MFYLPLALGQEMSHLVLVEGLGRFASQGGERDHPGMVKSLCAWQPASGKPWVERGRHKGCQMLPAWYISTAFRKKSKTPWLCSEVGNLVCKLAANVTRNILLRLWHYQLHGIWHKKEIICVYHTYTNSQRYSPSTDTVHPLSEYCDILCACGGFCTPAVFLQQGLDEVFSLLGYVLKTLLIKFVGCSSHKCQSLSITIPLEWRFSTESRIYKYIHTHTSQ